MKKNITNIILLFIFLLGMNRFHVEAAGNMRSGRTSVPKYSFEQLVNMYDSIQEYSNLYANKPVVKSGSYKAAKLSSQAYASALARINYYRMAAGLKPVKLKAKLNDSAAHGAVICAAKGIINHTPKKLSKMSKSFYKKAYQGTSKSNLAAASGYPANMTFDVAINGQMADAMGTNASSLGHRRWLLNPNTTTMGIGAANVGSSYFSAVRVMGSGVGTASAKDYKFISWPASGNNLSDTFDTNCPWSITLNPAVYKTPSYKKVKVTLKRESDGKKWTFNRKTGTSTFRSRSFFNVNNDGYGVRNCIIFRPAYRTLNSYKGDYTVTVTGLNTKKGASTSISYKVSFASRNSIENK